VHVLYKGQVIKSGDKTLAHELEAERLCRRHRRGGLSIGGNVMNIHATPQADAAETALVEGLRRAPVG
jgi:hypothetical protein